MPEARVHLLMSQRDVGGARLLPMRASRVA